MTAKDYICETLATSLKIKDFLHSTSLPNTKMKIVLFIPIPHRGNFPWPAFLDKAKPVS